MFSHLCSIFFASKNHVKVFGTIPGRNRGPSRLGRNHRSPGVTMGAATAPNNMPKWVTFVVRTFPLCGAESATAAVYI